MGGCICEFRAGCGGLGTIYCQGCGGDQCVCGACFGQGEIECPGCEDCEHEFGDVAYEFEGCCLGDRCVNPHPDHHASECATAEDLESWERAAREGRG